MKMKLTPAQMNALREYLNTNEDAELLAEKGGKAEYVADFYDLEPPVSANLVLAGESLFIDGAFTLAYDKELDGYYIHERIEAPGVLLCVLRDAGALPDA